MKRAKDFEKKREKKADDKRRQRDLCSLGVQTFLHTYFVEKHV